MRERRNNAIPSARTKVYYHVEKSLQLTAPSALQVNVKYFSIAIRKEIMDLVAKA